jgi:hypothetical protein
MRPPILIPYLSPEFIAAILGGENATPSNMRVESKPTKENSLPVQRISATVNETSIPNPFQWSVFWSRYFRIFAVVAKLTILWLV